MTLWDRFTHVITAAVYALLTYAYAKSLAGIKAFDWAGREDLFLIFKLEMFALVALGFLFIFSPIILRSWRGKAVAVAAAFAIIWGGYMIGQIQGLILLSVLIVTQFLSARRQILDMMQVGFAHMAGYVFVVILVRIFTNARDFNGLTADNILKPALVYFAVRTIVEIFFIFMPGRWAEKKLMKMPDKTGS